MDLAEQIPITNGHVVIHESSDNTGGGAPRDGTHLLREMLKRDLPGSAFGSIHDPEVATMAAKAGVGAKITCKLGGKTDSLHGEPIELVDAYVKCISDGKFLGLSPMGGGNYHKKSGHFLNVYAEDGYLAMYVYELTDIFRQTFYGREDKSVDPPAYYIGNYTGAVSEGEFKETVSQYIDTTETEFLYKDALTLDAFIEYVKTSENTDCKRDTLCGYPLFRFTLHTGGTRTI